MDDHHTMRQTAAPWLRVVAQIVLPPPSATGLGGRIRRIHLDKTNGTNGHGVTLAQLPLSPIEVFVLGIGGMPRTSSRRSLWLAIEVIVAARTARRSAPATTALSSLILTSKQSVGVLPVAAAAAGAPRRSERYHLGCVFLRPTFEAAQIEPELVMKSRSETRVPPRR
jgi:hypothetical protein